MIRNIIFILISLLFCINANAWEIGTAYTYPCHEEMTFDAVRRLLEDDSFVIEQEIPIPTGDMWRNVYGIFDDVINMDITDDDDKLTAVSLLLGARFQDISGCSISDINCLHRIHDDSQKQNAHFLRGLNDDWAGGDITALEKGRKFVMDNIELAKEYVSKPLGEQIINVPHYVDFYGKIQTQVWAPAFYLGVALHSFEDSFSHTVRSDDLHQIIHIMNWVDAGTFEYDQERDGLAHSSSMDECNDDAWEIYEIAGEATFDILKATMVYFSDNDKNELNNVFENWLSYKPGCTIKNNFCDSKWNDLVREDPAMPILFQGCQLSTGQSSQGAGTVFLSLVLLFVLRRKN